MTVLVNDILPLLRSHNEKNLAPDTFLVTIDQRRSIRPCFGRLVWPSWHVMPRLRGKSHVSLHIRSYNVPQFCGN